MDVSGAKIASITMGTIATDGESLLNAITQHPKTGTTIALGEKGKSHDNTN